jgi:hypothetical protein
MKERRYRPKERLLPLEGKIFPSGSVCSFEA